MSTLTLTARSGGDGLNGRVSLGGIIPSTLTGKSADDIAKKQLPVGAQTIALGDLFAVSGTPGDTLVIAGCTDQMDDVGERLEAGTLIVEGDVGGYAGRRMSGGTLEIKGNTGPYLASRMSGGLITVAESAGDYVGGIKAGEKFGMTGGQIVVDGNVGARAGDRMRRGSIIARGTFGAHAASRMMGGTLWTEAGFGAEPGALMRRGTLIGPAAETMLPTFIDAGRHDLVVLGILSSHMKRTLGPRAPKALPRAVRKYSGDMATIGKGELLLFG